MTQFVSVTSLNCSIRAEEAVHGCKGSLSSLAPKSAQFLEEKAAICQPDNVYICDGSDEENHSMIDTLLENGMIHIST
ncbi:hypothetical protein EB796_016343 [Bugula neritina]|uniref:Phosphoenolpyruvate carboxykinase GTP-utilising N-terminal domain-containing protein n=1 Tax=Bugula neritina TaxID=10212 RepID=A0A7J7JI94_BUGNE|nr:hypothetical protein EB796_016343 [Bugula neritina]